MTVRRITPARIGSGLYGAALSGRNPNVICAAVLRGREDCRGAIAVATLNQGRVAPVDGGYTIADRSEFDARPPGLQPGNSRLRLSP